MAKKAKKSTEEVVTKKSTKKTATKAAAGKAAKKASSNGSVQLYFGRHRATSAMGLICEALYQSAGKAVKDSALQKLIGSTPVAGRLAPLAAWGKKTGHYTVTRSKKVDGAHVMHVKNHKAYLNG